MEVKFGKLNSNNHHDFFRDAGPISTWLHRYRGETPAKRLITLAPDQTRWLLCKIWPSRSIYLNGLEAGKTYELSLGRKLNKEKGQYDFQ